MSARRAAAPRARPRSLEPIMLEASGAASVASLLCLLCATVLDPDPGSRHAGLGGRLQNLDPVPAALVGSKAVLAPEPGSRLAGLGGRIQSLDHVPAGRVVAARGGLQRPGRLVSLADYVRPMTPSEEGCSAQGVCVREEGCSAQCASAVARTHCAGGKWCGKRRGSVVWTHS